MDESQADALLADIHALDCKKHFGDHTEDYGEVVIYITYADETAEVIGLWNVAQVDAEGSWRIGTEYFVANDIAYCIAFDMPTELLYVTAYIIPLYIP